MMPRAIRAAVIILSCALSFTASVSAATGAPKSPESRSKAACSVGEMANLLGLKWKCQKVDGRSTFVAVGVTVGNGAPGGSLGKCTTGDWVQVAAQRLECRKVGVRAVWSGAKRGAIAAKADAWIQDRPPAITGSCRGSSWLKITGVLVSCLYGNGEEAWSSLSHKPVGGSQQSATLSRPNGASKAACLNAWWDKEFAGLIPQLARKQDTALTEQIWSYCHLVYKEFMTTAERDATYAGFFGQVGQLVANEVQRVSAAKGLNPCQAVDSVLRPQYAPGFGLTGWDVNGFLPILYKQWQNGPMIGKLGSAVGNCSNGQISVQFRRHYNGSHEGPYYPQRGTPDATFPFTEYDMGISSVDAATCLVWSPTFGNTGVGSAARVIGYNFTSRGDGNNLVVADNEVTKCEFKIAEAAGLPVVWKAVSSASDFRTVPDDFAGIWHTMVDGCSWSLKPANGGSTVSWNPTDGPYIAVELQAGDQFASTCRLQKNEWQHMVVAPDGLFPLWSLAPGPRRPTTPATCRYALTNRSALRNPQPAGALQAYRGETVNFDTSSGSDGIGVLLRSVGCGSWTLA